jgi:uncharacterized protein YidB (DUF937 family)
VFTKITPTADSQLSNEDVANLIVSDALEKIAQLTGLNQEKAFVLLANQINQSSNNLSHDKTIKIQTPILEQNEFQFISSLFN